jgi:hypothetical protein
MKKTASNDNLITKMEIVRDLAKKSKLTHWGLGSNGTENSVKLILIFC